MNNHQYLKYANSKVKPSPILKNCFFAFLIGGLICVLGQVFAEIFQSWGVDKKDSFGYAGICLIFLSAFLTCIGKYDNIAKHGGAGTLVPITGFANAIVSPAIEFKNEGFVMGVCANMFKIAGPVIVYGLVTSFISGLIYYIFLMIGLI